MSALPDDLFGDGRVTRSTALDRPGAGWPNHAASRFVTAAGLRWHVQILGDGPVLLLLHGAGGATHSWRDLAPALAAHFTVVAPDLPGHAFTQRGAAAQMSLPGMAAGVHGLLDELGMTVEMVAGHSAGAAIAARMCLDRRLQPRALVSLNGALLPLPGLAGRIFSPAARVLTRVSLAPRLFARAARGTGTVERLISDTGSTLEPEGVALYRRLAGDAAHVGATLAMMAHWNVDALPRELPRLEPPLTLVVGSRDRTVSPREAVEVQGLVPGARVVELAGLGHLAHEEAPRRVCTLLLEAGARAGIVAAEAAQQ